MPINVTNPTSEHFVGLLLTAILPLGGEMTGIL